MLKTTSIKKNMGLFISPTNLGILLSHYLTLFITVKAIMKMNLGHRNKFEIGPLHDPVTWYKIKYTGEHDAQWDVQTKAGALFLEVPLRNLLASICNFVPRDRVVQRPYFKKLVVVLHVLQTTQNW